MATVRLRLQRLPLGDAPVIGRRDAQLPSIRIGNSVRVPVDALHDLTQLHDRLRTSHHRLIDEQRRLRESILSAELAS